MRNFTPNPANLGIFFPKNRPDMDVRSIIFWKISRRPDAIWTNRRDLSTSLLTKCAFSGSGPLPLPGVLYMLG